MNDNIKGALFIVVACAFIAATTAIAKQLGAGSAAEPLHPLQVSFGRFLFGFLSLLPFAVFKPPRFQGTQWPQHAARVVCGWGGVSCMFAAVAFLPLADATAISFLNPFFAMVLAILFLGEVVGKWRWGAAAIAFAGVLVLTQPGSSAFQPAALIALSAAALMGMEVLFIKLLTGREPHKRILLINNGAGAVISGLAAALVWQPATGEQWLMLAAIGSIMVTAQVFFLRGMTLGETNFVAPFLFMTLPFAALYGGLFFGEVPALTTLAGAALILSGAGVLGWRERLAARRQATAEHR